MRARLTEFGELTNVGCRRRWLSCGMACGLPVHGWATSQGTPCLDHLRDLGVPQGRIGKWRVHHDVIEAVAPGAIGFDRIEARPLLQLYGFLLGSGHKWHGTSGHKDDQSAHGELPQATLNVTLCTTLW